MLPDRQAHTTMQRRSGTHRTYKQFPHLYRQPWGIWRTVGTYPVPSPQSLALTRLRRRRGMYKYFSICYTFNTIAMLINTFVSDKLRLDFPHLRQQYPKRLLCQHPSRNRTCASRCPSRAKLSWSLMTSPCLNRLPYLHYRRLFPVFCKGGHVHCTEAKVQPHTLPCLLSPP